MSSSSSCSSSKIIRSPVFYSYFMHLHEALPHEHLSCTLKCGYIIFFNSSCCFFVSSSFFTTNPNEFTIYFCASVYPSALGPIHFYTFSFPLLLVISYFSSFENPVYLLTVEMQVHFCKGASYYSISVKQVLILSRINRCSIDRVLSRVKMAICLNFLLRLDREPMKDSIYCSKSGREAKSYKPSTTNP